MLANPATYTKEGAKLGHTDINNGLTFFHTANRKS